MPFCRSCGHEVEVTDRFCEGCGADRARASAASAGSAPVAPAVVPQEPPTPILPRPDGKLPCAVCGVGVAPQNMDYHVSNAHSRTVGTPRISPAAAAVSEVAATPTLPSAQRSQPADLTCRTCGITVASGSMDYHRLHKHGATGLPNGERPEPRRSRLGVVVATAVVLIGAVAIAVAASGGSATSDAGSTGASTSSSDSEPASVDTEQASTVLDEDLTRLEAMRVHTQSWNAAAGPLVAAIVDEDVSIEDTVAVAEEQLPTMREAADGIVQASLALEDPEVARIVGAIGRNYQQKYTAIDSLVSAIEQEDDAATQANGQRVDELVTAAQDLARELLAYLRGEGYEFDIGVGDEA